MNLIKKIAHREDLPIISMGMKFFSSYDACTDCNKMIYDGQDKLKNILSHRLNNEYYSIYDSENNNTTRLSSNTNSLIPFHTFFYSSRPFQTNEYSLINSSKQSIKGNVVYKFINSKPFYHFQLQPTEDSKKIPKNISFKTGKITIKNEDNFILSHVVQLENQLEPIEIKKIIK